MQDFFEVVDILIAEQRSFGPKIHEGRIKSTIIGDWNIVLCVSFDQFEL